MQSRVDRTHPWLGPTTAARAHLRDRRLGSSLLLPSPGRPAGSRNGWTRQRSRQRGVKLPFTLLRMHPSRQLEQGKRSTLTFLGFTNGLGVFAALPGRGLGPGRPLSL